MAGGWDGGRALAIGDVVGHERPAERARGTAWWAVARCRARGEAAAVEKLVDRGIDAFAPMETRRVQTRDGKREDRECAVFPGYVIVDIGAFGLTDAESTGVRIVRLAGPKSEPGRLSPADVTMLRDGWPAAMKAREAARLAAKALENKDKFAVGDLVRVTEGPLAGFVRRVEALDKAGRVGFLPGLLGSRRKAWVPGGLLERVLPHDEPGLGRTCPGEGEANGNGLRRTWRR